MKKIGYIYICVIGCLFVSCASSEKLLQKGKYDQAIEKSSKKLSKNPDNEEELAVLKEAFYQANRVDREEIEFLEKENPEMNSVEIYQLYSRLDQRQDRLKALPPGVRNEFDFVEYDDAIIESKSMAASISYERGLDYLDRQDRESARRAYYEFERAHAIYPGYREVEKLMNESRYMGTNQVLFTIENNSDSVLPEDFDTELKKIALKELNTQWVNFDTQTDTMQSYDYYVVLNIKSIDVTPESIDRKIYTETREIQDGEKYVLDEDGNVKKDSLGNDIKEPNMVTIAADVTESFQHKNAFVGGSIDYVDLYSDQLIKTEPLSVEAEFNFYSAAATGNMDALSEETAEKVGRRPVPFPSNEAMLLDAADLLKVRAKDVIAQNRRVLEN